MSSKLTSGTDCTGPKPDGPATGSLDTFGDRLVGAVAKEEIFVDNGCVCPIMLPLPPHPCEDGLMSGVIDEDELTAAEGGIEFVELELIVMLMPGGMVYTNFVSNRKIKKKKNSVTLILICNIIGHNIIVVIIFGR